MPWAASPPSTFCHEKVATSSLSQSSGCANAAEVASQMVSPARSAAIKSPFGTRTPDVVPFQVKTTSLDQSTLAKIGQFAVAGLEHGRVLELQLLDDVVDPAFAEGFPRQHRDRPSPEQRPQRQFDGAGVGRRHDADPMTGGDLQHLAGEVDGALELGLADAGAVRTSERRVGERLKAPARTLGAGAGRKMRIPRPHCGLAMLMALPFQIGAPRWGGVSRRFG